MMKKLAVFAAIALAVAAILSTALADNKSNPTDSTGDVIYSGPSVPHAGICKTVCPYPWRQGHDELFPGTRGTYTPLPDAR